MKKLLLIAAIFCSITLNAQDFHVGKLFYTINDDGVTVTVTGHIDGIGAMGDLEIPESVTYENQDYTVTAIGYRAFYNCAFLDGTLTLPNTITSIGDCAFDFCQRLHGDITIPDAVTYIGEHAFSNTNFDGYLTLGENVTTIGEAAFGGCSFNGLLIIPSSVTSIGSYAFWDCTGFSYIICMARVPPTIGDRPFENMDCSKLIVPFGRLSVYRNSEWNQYFDTFVETWSGSYWLNYAGGNGSPENPYQIANSEQLALLAWMTYEGCDFAHYILTNDIFLFNDRGYDWRTIGDYDINVNSPRYFRGVFDGNNHKIFGLNIENPGQNMVSGLFGCTDNATIKNVHIENAHIKNGVVTGALVGSAQNTIIENCTVTNSHIEYSQTAGGIVGTYTVNADDTFYIKDCVNEARLDSIYDGAGIVSAISVESGDFKIESCINKGNIIAQNCSGGIAGMAIQSLITNCQNFGRTYGGKSGGIVGRVDNCIVQNCINNETGVFDGGDYNAGGIVAQFSNGMLLNCQNYASGYGNTIGGIVGLCNDIEIRQCTNNGTIFGKGSVCGGIMGTMGYQNILVDIYDCVNKGDVVGDSVSAAGGISGKHANTITRCVNKGTVKASPATELHIGGLSGGFQNYITNSYNRGDVIVEIKTLDESLESVWAGGIVGTGGQSIENVYNTGDIYIPSALLASNIQVYRGNIAGYEYENTYDLNCYWLDDDDIPACGNPDSPDLPGSSAFHRGDYPPYWLLTIGQYGTNDMIKALNAGANHECVWIEDVNGGLPIITNYEDNYPLIGDEWYYEITNENGSVTYQYLECAADTTIGTSRPKVIVKSNTLYDKGLNVVKTHEYVYSENGVVYWWDKLSGSYTTLYNFNANVGDEWTISVGNQSITMHVDAVSYTEYSGTFYRIMTVSDAQDIFGGQIICGIGHTRSFFPERLLSKNRSYRVDGMRCYWVDGEPIIQFGDVDCDEIYEEHHQTTPPSDNKISVYPNPAYDFILINVKQPTHYTISDIFGKTILKGIISSDNQQINIENLPDGMYFVNINNQIVKIIKN